MPNYSYRARDKAGKLVAGVSFADDEKIVARKLTESGFVPVSIKEDKSGSKKNSGFFGGFAKVKLSELQMFTKQLSVLQRAGIPFIMGLKALREQSESPLLAGAISDIIADIEGGGSVSQAMAKHPHIFDKLYVNLIKAGEQAGVLTDSLDRLARLQESEEKMQMRIKAAVRYPIMVVAALVIGITLLVTMVVPAFAKIYKQMGTSLPLPTQILIGTYEVMKNYWWAIILGFIGLVFLFKRFINTSQGRRFWDGLRLKVIVFGPLNIKITMSRFARTTAILMRSGIPILEVLDLVADIVSNAVVAEKVRDIRDEVNRGMGMAAPMRTSGMFTPVVIQMVSVGEDTGKTDELLMHVADYYDAQADYTIDNLTSLIEPILLLVMGGAVLLVMLGVFLPMWNMSGLMMKS
jgi:type II secretory pathway component PulF